MRKELLELLRCPTCEASLTADGEIVSGEIDVGLLSCPGCRRSYPIVRGIPRFVPAESYVQNFGVQWNTFKNTQLDSRTGQPISANRFRASTGWEPERLRGRWVLDAGCGAGRFAEVAAAFGARVVAVDLSNAVDAARDNPANSDVEFIHADINALPFAPGTFPFVYCLGVIMHTPDPARSFHALARATSPGGSLVVDVYPKLWRNIFFAKYWIRPITKRMIPEKCLRLVRRIFPILYPISRTIARIPFIGHYLRYLVPVVNYEGVYDLSENDLWAWGLLDTFDMWAPAHDRPQSRQTVADWFKSADFQDVEVFRRGVFVGRGIKRESRRCAES